MCPVLPHLLNVLRKNSSLSYNYLVVLLLRKQSLITIHASHLLMHYSKDVCFLCVALIVVMVFLLFIRNEPISRSLQSM